MNNLMTRRKKYRFQVELRVEELQHVPFVNQVLYAKVRLLEGGFTSQSQKVMVQEHAVKWDEAFRFPCKMTANPSTGELDSCICRVSVRQEVRGGKSFQKLGYADINLAQFAGSGGGHTYLLEAYDSKHRLHNSTLQIMVDMTLQSGDPCFKAQPLPGLLHSPLNESASSSEAASLPLSLTRPVSDSKASLASLGYSSLDKKSKVEETEAQLGEQGHSRNSSNTSGSGYVSNASHSDKSGHARSSSLGSGGCSEGGSLEWPINAHLKSHDGNKDSRVESTREDANDMVNQIFQDTIGTLKPSESSEPTGLQIYIGKDGKVGVSGRAADAQQDFLPVNIAKR